MDINTFKQTFENVFYQPTYLDWRIKKKSGKDIVGAHYENFRSELYKQFGLELSKKKKKIFGSSYNADLAIEKNGKIILVEEDKGHYVDSCFLKRAVGNFAEVVSNCIDKKVNVPYFVLSCSTKMRNFNNIFDSYIKIYREDIQKEIKEKFLYFPLCENGRIDAKKYFQSNQNCFSLSDKLLTNQINFLNSLRNEN